MSTIKLKVCGMREPGNIREIGAIGPDYMGFIFYPKSPRFVGPEFSVHELKQNITPVGVFVNESINNIKADLARIGSRIAQLHGHESADDCKRLKDADIAVIKAIAVGPEFDTSVLKEYGSAVDYFLFDTKGKLFGGNAVKFDWKLLTRYDGDIPFFLSGGIGVADVGALDDLDHAKLYAVDLNSGVEISPGLKDPSRVRKAKELIDKL